MRRDTMITMPNPSHQIKKGGLSFVAMTVLMALVLMVAGCGDDVKFKVGPAKSDKKEADVAAVLEPEADKGAIEKDYIYTSIGKRDPFRSIFDDGDEQEWIGGGGDILTPLQNYDVNSFVVSAILWGVSSPTAMLIAPDSESYIVKTGTLIGREWGRVVKIKSDAVVVLEQTTLLTGIKVSNLIELKLPVNLVKANDNEIDLDDEGDEQVDTQGLVNEFD